MPRNLEKFQKYTQSVEWPILFRANPVILLLQVSSVTLNNLHYIEYDSWKAARPAQVIKKIKTLVRKWLSQSDVSLSVVMSWRWNILPECTAIWGKWGRFSNVKCKWGWNSSSKCTYTRSKYIRRVGSLRLLSTLLSPNLSVYGQHAQYTWFLPQTSQDGNKCTLVHHYIREAKSILSWCIYCAYVVHTYLHYIQQKFP